MPSYTVKTGGYDQSLAASSQRKLARTSDGTLWCVYSRSDGTYYQIYASYSKDGGKTWIEEQVSYGTDTQDRPGIAVDSEDNIHVVWRGLGWGNNPDVWNLQYRKRTSSGWQPQEAVTDENADQEHPSIAVDSNDNLHIVWLGLGWGTNTGYYNIQYRRRTSSGWQSREAVSDIDANQLVPMIAIDDDDNVHVVWRGTGWGTNTGYHNIQYRKRTSTGWEPQEAVTDKDADQVNPSIAIDSGGNVHVVWFGKGWGTNTTNWNIQYKRRTSSGWGSREAVTDKNADQTHPVIAIDKDDNIHIVWRGLGWGTNTGYYNIQYCKRTNSGWQSRVGLTDTANNHHFPNGIWALHPTVLGQKTNRPRTGYAFVWVDGTTIKFYRSSDFTISTILHKKFGWKIATQLTFYKRPITISSDSTSTLTDFQVLVTIDTASLISAGKMESDCRDIRFFDSDGSLLNYWLEGPCNDANTKIWVKVPSIPPGSKTIYICYGNPLDTTNQSNGDATFEFFDDFESKSTGNVPNYPITGYKKGQGTDNIALTPGASGEFDSQKVLHPCIVVKDGTIYMFYTGFNDSGERQIGLAIADVENFTGTNFTKYSGNPILTPTETWEGNGVGYPCVIYDTDARIWKMWYGSSGKIGYATSDDGIHWTKYSGNPILTPTETWEGDQIGHPSVLKISSTTYKMLYTGKDPGDLDSQIGLATSSDGINWIKEPSNPVISPSGSGWKSEATFTARTFKYEDDGKYHILYGGKDASTYSKVGYAESTDCVNWIDSSYNPILVVTRSWEGDEVENPFQFSLGNKIYIYYDCWFSDPPRIGVLIIEKKIDTSKWVIKEDKAGTAIKDGKLILGGDDLTGDYEILRTVNTYSESSIVEMKNSLSALSPSGWHTIEFGWRTSSNEKRFAYMWINDDRKWRLYYPSGYVENLGTHTPSVGDYRYKTYVTSSKSRMEQSGSLTDSVEITGSYSPTNSHFELNSGHQTAFNKWDWIFIRKYADPEPTVSVGDEIEIILATVGWKVVNLFSLNSTWKLLTREILDSQWRIFGELVRDVAWQILAMETISRIIEWKLLVAQDISPAWKLLNMSETNSQWKILDKFGLSSSWKLLTRSDETTTWKILNEFGKEIAWKLLLSKSKDISWQILILNIMSKLIVWKLITYFDVDATWKILDAVKRDTSWKSLVSKDRTTAWKLLTSLDTTSAWKLLSEVSRQSSWKLLTTKGRSLSWQILLLYVLSRDLTWKLIATDDLSFKWRILTGVELDSSWKLFNWLDKDASWKILDKFTTGTVWKILNEKQKDLSWKLFEEEIKELAWSILSEIYSRDVAWKILKSEELDTKWLVGLLYRVSREILLDSQISKEIILESNLNVVVKK